MRDRGPGFDPGRGAARPPRRARVDHRPHGAPRRHGDRAHATPGRRHRGRADDGGRASERPERRHRRRPRSSSAPACAPSSSGRVEVVGEADGVEERRARRSSPSRARRRPARRAHAGRRRRGGDPPGAPSAARRSASSPSRSPTRPRTSSPSSAPAPAATSPRRSPAPSSPTPCGASPTATPSSRPAWPASCSTPSPGTLPAAEVDPELDQLTAREREVLRHIARGYIYKEIALRLGISAKTVEAHVSAVLRKLQLSNRHELSRWAAERRLVD